MSLSGRGGTGRGAGKFWRGEEVTVMTRQVLLAGLIAFAFLTAGCAVAQQATEEKTASALAKDIGALSTP